MGVGLGRGMGMGKGLGAGAGSGAIGPQIARLLANIVVMSGGVLGRHFMQAYKEALANGGKAAAGAATTKARHVGMPEAEAKLILNLSAKTTEEEIKEASAKLVAMNDLEKGGSAYITGKIENAREALIAPSAEAAADSKEAPK